MCLILIFNADESPSLSLSTEIEGNNPTAVKDSSKMLKI